LGTGNEYFNDLFSEDLKSNIRENYLTDK